MQSYYCIVRAHSFLHRGVLLWKITQNEVKKVLSEETKVENFIKTEVRWLSKMVLSHVNELL